MCTICMCVCDYLINYEYFNNLNGDEDMISMGMGWICTSLSPSLYRIVRVGYSLYTYP